MNVTTDATGGAFSVTSQNAAGINYNGNSSQTITWNAGSTAAAPFNAANVDILITYNNGATWSTILAGTPNDGYQVVIMPNPAATQNNCRIMVRSAVTATQKSFFFDLNNTAFTINTVLANDNFELQAFEMSPNPTIGNFTVKFIPQSKDVAIEVYDVRGREVFERAYINNEVVFNQNISLNDVQAGVYLVSITDGNNRCLKRIIVE